MPSYVLLDLGLDGAGTCGPSSAPGILRPCVCSSVWAAHKHDASVSSWSTVVSAEPGSGVKTYKTCRQTDRSGMRLAAMYLDHPVVVIPLEGFVLCENEVKYKSAFQPWDQCILTMLL